MLSIAFASLLILYGVGALISAVGLFSAYDQIVANADGNKKLFVYQILVGVFAWPYVLTK